MGAVPFCDPCARHWTPTSLRPDGSCPTCGQVLEAPKRFRPAVAPPRPEEEGAERSKAPWHFKLLLSVLVVYLAWRGVQGVEWVAHHL